MAYSPSLVANAFVFLGQRAKLKFDHLQVQKLVFFAHAWSLTVAGESVVAERPEAWPHGPIFASLYYRLKPFGPKAIPLLPELHVETGHFIPLIPDDSDQLFWFFIHQVFHRYGKCTGPELSALAHEPNGPWAESRQSKSLYLQDSVIREHFDKQLAADPKQREELLEAARAAQA